MSTIRLTVCSLVALAGLGGAASTASAQGLVGFYVYPDAYGRGLVIGSFIPGTSADALHWQGQLMPGDIITHYNGRRVYSAAQIRHISYHSGGGRMDFITPSGLPFWHFVDVYGGGGPAVAAYARNGSSQPAAPAKSLKFRMGSARPSDNSATVRPQGPGLPIRPDFPGPGRPGGPGRPR